MLSFITDLFSFLAHRRENHPVYRRERSGWAYPGLWRDLRRGCLPLIILILITPALCCGSMSALLIFQTSGEPATYLLALIAAVFGVSMGGEIVLWLGTLLATVLGGTAISAEIQSQTYAMLRTTLITPRDFVFAKFAVAVRQMRPAVMTAFLTRLFTPLVLAGIIILGLALIIPSSGSTPSSLPSPGGSISLPNLLPWLPSLATWLVALAVWAVAIMIMIIWYLIQPYLNMLLFSAVGIFGSTLGKTREGGIFGAVGIRLVLWMVSYTATQIFSVVLQFLFAPMIFLPGITDFIEYLSVNLPGVLLIGPGMMMIIGILITILSQLGVTLLLLYWSINRCHKLPYGIG